MGYKVYENVINMELMWQMRQMIAEAAGMQLIEPRCRKPLFKRRAVQESMENKFRFHYPGEILERYHERCGDTVQNLPYQGYGFTRTALVQEATLGLKLKYTWYNAVDFVRA